jgi:Holliday junction resolvasome RuvABC DNA-binding subunit
MKDIRNAISKVQNGEKDLGTEEMIKQALKELR